MLLGLGGIGIWFEIGLLGFYCPVIDELCWIGIEFMEELG